MSVNLDTLFAEAMSLPEDARLSLIERLIPTIQSDPDLDAEQLSEAALRVEEIQSGAVTLIPSDEVFE